jgi:hypothetical protein
VWCGDLVDIILILNYIYSSTSIKTSETWTPLTVPGIQEDVVLCVYINYFTPNLGLVVVCNDAGQDVFFDC